MLRRGGACSVSITTTSAHPGKPTAAVRTDRAATTPWFYDADTAEPVIARARANVIRTTLFCAIHGDITEARYRAPLY